MRPILAALVLALQTLLGTAVLAQGTGVSLGGLSVDPTAPVEITSDQFSVDQATGIGVFSGNVVIGQDALRLAAGRVEVAYNEGSGAITRLKASGGVTFVTQAEAAEAQAADYDLTAKRLTLRGNVLLSQGRTAISGDRMEINLETGRAQVTGNVKTILGGGQ